MHTSEITQVKPWENLQVKKTDNNDYNWNLHSANFIYTSILIIEPLSNK